VPISRLLPALATLALGATVAQAEDSWIVGPRALGMGGTGVAAPEDYVAQYYNPAVFAWFSNGQSDGSRWPSDNQDLQRKTWGAGLDVTAGARFLGKLGDYLNDVLKINTDTLQRIGQSGATDASNLTDLMRAVRAVAVFDPQRDAILADVNAGMGIRINHFGIGFRTYDQALGQIKNIDKQHIGIDLPGGSTLQAQISNVVVPGVGAGYTPTNLSSAQQATLLAALGNSQDAVNKIDAAMTQAGISGSEVQSVVDLFSSVTSATNSGLTFGTNDTTFRLVGLSVNEIPISYGYALDEHFAIGGSVKFMVGRVYGLDVPVFSTSAKKIDDYLSDAKNDYQQSMNGGIDLSISTRWSMFQAGLIGRNLNAPSFKGPTVNGVTFDDIRVEPSAAAGIAFIPWETVTLAADLDLTQAQTALEAYKVQRASVGLEWNILHTLALRGGLSKNIAETDDPALVSAGVGLNLYALRVDVAGQAAAKTITYDGKDYPQEARASLAVATDW
jgi:F plasmid transfer operon, TraF, protein